MPHCDRTALRHAWLVVACLILQTLATPAALAAEDTLWLSYAAGSDQRAALLKECGQRLDQLKATATKSGPLGPGADWSADEDVRWLLTNRTPAVLCIGRELDVDQPDPYLAALVWTSARLGHRDLLVKLPGTLAKADTDETRQVIIQVLADLRSPPAVQSLEKFLNEATEKTPEALVCAACEGLGHTRDSAHLPLIVKSGRWVQTPSGRVHLAAARQECGDATAGDELVDALRDEKTAPEVRVFVLVFLADHPMESASPAVADVAVSVQDEALAQLALDVLMKLTGYDLSVTDQPAADAAPAAAEKTAVAEKATDAQAKAPEGPKPEDFAKLSKEDRKKVTTKILDWWHEHPPEVRQQGVPKTPPPPQ